MVTLPVCMAEAKEKNSSFFIELYIIELKSGTIRLAACDEDIRFAGDTYMAVPIQRESVTRSMDNITDSCTLSISDVDYGLLAYVMNGFDFRGVNAAVIRIQYPESLSDEKAFEWVYSGFIDEPSFAEGTFSCRIMSRFPEIQCPNRNYQLCCNSEFGDSECGVDLGLDSALVLSQDGNVLKLRETFEDNYWKNGVVTCVGESRIIQSSKADTLTVNVNFLQDMVSKKVTLQRGCNKTQTDCKRFDNLRNYSGFPAIPFESIYR